MIESVIIVACITEGLRWWLLTGEADSGLVGTDALAMVELRDELGTSLRLGGQG